MDRYKEKIDINIFLNNKQTFKHFTTIEYSKIYKNIYFRRYTIQITHQFLILENQYF